MLIDGHDHLVHRHTQLTRGCVDDADIRLMRTSQSTSDFFMSLALQGFVDDTRPSVLTAILKTSLPFICVKRGSPSHPDIEPRHPAGRMQGGFVGTVGMQMDDRIPGLSDASTHHGAGTVAEQTQVRGRSSHR